jgi:hypothetical protein
MFHITITLELKINIAIDLIKYLFYKIFHRDESSFYVKLSLQVCIRHGKRYGAGYFPKSPITQQSYYIPVE